MGPVSRQGFGGEFSLSTTALRVQASPLGYIAMSPCDRGIRLTEEAGATHVYLALTASRSLNTASDRQQPQKELCSHTQEALQRDW